MSLAPIPSIFSDSIYSDIANQTHDAMGNIFDAAGTHVGVVPGSQADLGTTGAIPPIAAPPAAPTTNPIASIMQAPDLSTLGSKIKAKISPNWQKLIFGIDLEDGLFIVIGLLLIAAGLYGFSTVRDASNEFVKAAVKSAAEGAA